MVLHLKPLPSERATFVQRILFDRVIASLRVWWHADRRERLVRRIAREKVRDKQRARALVLNAHITNTTR